MFKHQVILFIYTYLECYGSNPCHYSSSPVLSWDAMLKRAEIKIDVISNIGMYLFVLKGMREGISYIAKRFSDAEYKYMQ